jgi:hypothetical protein
MESLAKARLSVFLGHHCSGQTRVWLSWRVNFIPGLPMFSTSKKNRIAQWMSDSGRRGRRTSVLPTAICGSQTTSMGAGYCRVRYALSRISLTAVLHQLDRNGFSSVSPANSFCFRRPITKSPLGPVCDRLSGSLLYKLSRTSRLILLEGVLRLLLRSQMAQGLPGESHAISVFEASCVSRALAHV